MKFIHSSDLQIGKAFGCFEPETATILQDARQAVVRTLGEAAAASGATAVLIAGDIYEKQQMAQLTLVRPIEGMRSFGNIQWHLMPGNHDHFRENGLWDRLARLQLPSNVRLHIRPGAVLIADDGEVPEGVGVEEILLAAEAERDHLTSVVAEFEQEAEVLRLLLATLETAESEAKNRYLAPGVTRVEPYLKMLLPGAAIVLDEDLHIAAIQRAGQREEFEILSGGTQEQLACPHADCVRRAFAWS